MVRLETQYKSLMACIYTIGSTIFLAIVALLIKLTNNIPVFQSMNVSTLTTSIVTFYLCGMLNVNLHLTKQNAYRYLDLRCIFGGIALASGYLGMRLIPLTEAAVLENLSPVWASFLCAIYLKEEFTKKHIILATLSFCGVILISKPEIFFSSYQTKINEYVNLEYRVVGILALICMSFFKVLVGICIRKLDSLVKFNPLLMVFYFFVWCSVISAVISVFGEEVKPVSFKDSLLLGSAGILYTIGHICYSRAFQLETVGKIMILNQSKVLFNFLFDLFVLGIYLDIYSIIGCCLITGSLIFLTKK